MIPTWLCDGDTVLWKGSASSKAEGEWLRHSNTLYVIAKVFHEYSPATDEFIQHVLLAKIPTKWFEGAK